MLDSALKINRFLMGYCRMLIGDIPDERMVEQPLPGVNHPAWSLGHLAWSTDRGRSLLGLEPECPSEWTATFGFGSKPSASRGDYPSRDELIAALGAKGIGTSVHFIPIHRLDYYRERYGYRPEDLPVANSAFEQLVSLPIYPAMTEEDVQDVVDAVVGAVGAPGRG